MIASFAILISVLAIPSRSWAFEAAFQSVQIRKGSHAGQVFSFYRLSRAGEVPTYALWVPPDPLKSTRAAVLLTQPYAGIAWSGEEVDRRWWNKRGADLLPQYLPDEDGPGYLPARGSRVNYEPKTEAMLLDEARVYLENGVGALFVFHRFYAGGTIEKAVQDTALGFEFLSRRPEVDPARIGVMGGSWGGFEAVHGAAAASAGAPRAGVAYYPVIDFERWVSYVTGGLLRSLLEPARWLDWMSVFEPYLRRIEPVAAASGLRRFTTESIAARLRTDFLLIHDTWDTLIPVSQSQGLAKALPGRVQLFSQSHRQPLDIRTRGLSHFDTSASEGFDASTASLFAYSYLLPRIVPSDRLMVIPVQLGPLHSLLVRLRERALSRAEREALTARLVDMASPSLWLVATDAPGTEGPGNVWVSSLLNAIWGVRCTPADVREVLQSSGLPR